MVLSISIKPETEARLREQAQAAGKDVSDYVAQLVEQAAGRASLEEVLEPLRKQFVATGKSDEQLVDEITEAQRAYRDDQHTKKTA
jgi:hypothetical protein